MMKHSTHLPRLHTMPSASPVIDWLLDDLVHTCQRMRTRITALRKVPRLILNYRFYRQLNHAPREAWKNAQNTIS